ncbi:hypothetical protein M3226_03195 [Neobacillus cucumis]|uniref:hypothetical protein n=1 Tax=Neobacillus cucumis TaxID=1740721 RepID=UPI00204219CB|nr:hypothetical protein [Neobacillus cucumis]MCM3724703.1 hypothetical protein [Neobacillus cucumis]
MSVVKIGVIGIGKKGSSHVQMINKVQIKEKINASTIEKKQVTNTTLDVTGMH